MKKITILIPCYNEEQNLPLIYPELVKLMDSNQAYEWELLFVNDGSHDGTLELLHQLREKDGRVNFVSLSRNFGKEVAMLAEVGVTWYTWLEQGRPIAASAQEINSEPDTQFTWRDYQSI